MARNVVDELVVRLTADASRLQAELGKAERGATESGKKVGASFGTAFRNAARLGAIATASLTAVGTAFFVAANKAAAYADQIDKTAIRTRISRGALQELAFAADQAGVQFTAIEANIRAFTGRLAEAERGSATVIGTFDRLGVSLRDQNGALRDTESLFLDTIEALSGIDNESTRAALAVQAFGEQGSALLPFLSLGAEGLDDLRAKARELGLVLDDQAIGSLVAYKDEVSALGQQFAAVQREAVTKLIPVLRDDVIPLVRDQLLPAFVSLVNFLADDVAPVVGTIATNFTDLSTAFNTFVQSWESGEGRLEGTLGVLERIRNVLGFNPAQGLDGILDLAYGTGNPNGSGGRDGTVPRGTFTGPDFSNPDTAFGPQPRPTGYVPPPGSNAPPPPGGGGAAGAVARTVADVFADLAADGAARERFAAAFGLTPENIITSATARQGLVESALRELLTDFAGVVTDAQIAFLVERYTALGEVIRQNTDAPIPLPAPTGSVGNLPFLNNLGARAISDRGARRGDGGLSVVLDAERALRDLANAADLAATEGFQLQTGLVGQQIRDELLAGIDAGAVSDRGRRRGDGGLSDQLAIELERRQKASADLRAAEEGLQLQTGLLGQQLAAEREARRAALLAGIGAGAVSDRGRTRGDGGLGAGTTPFGVITPPGVPAEIQSLIDAGSKVRFELEMAASAAAAEERAAALDFRFQVAQGAVDFAKALISGDAANIIEQGFKTFGDIGAALLPGFGPFIKLGTDFFGSLFGGLFPSQDSSDAARAAGATPGGAPAIELNLSVFQNLAVNSLTGGDRAAVDGLLDQTVSRIESVLVSFGQRLTAVEARTA